MNYRLVFRPEVVSDLATAIAWYESQMPGLGNRFLDEYFVALRFIRSSAGTPRKVFAEFRRVLLKKFPFVVWYEVDRSTAIILLVWDSRQDPAKLRQLLRTR